MLKALDVDLEDEEDPNFYTDILPDPLDESPQSEILFKKRVDAQKLIDEMKFAIVFEALT